MFMSASETETSRGPRQRPRQESWSPEPMDLDQEEHTRPFAHRHAARVPYCDDPYYQGTVIPNRIFVGGIDSTILENDLGRFFSEYGQVNEVKIMTDPSGCPKGYGFVSFETREDVQRLLQNNADRVQFRDKVFYIAPAIRKKHHQKRGYEGHTRSYNPRLPSTPAPVAPQPVPCPPVPCPYGPVYLITPDGLPYTYHNGVAYFQMPEEDIQSAHHWTSSSGIHHAYPPVILSPPPQFPPQQPAYHYYQYMQEEYLQHSVYLYQDVEQPRASGGWVHPSVPYPAISEEQTVQDRSVPRIKARHSRRFSHKHRAAPMAYIPEVSEPEEPSEPLVTQAVE